ncbi:MAG: hypothetical protein H0U53_03350 [Actinobacteria bacterium]|nr:hypothetical protein [Actinomycetota bacterium]
MSKADGRAVSARQLRMKSETWSRLGGICAMLGGAFWVMKSVAILLTGIQPPLVFEIAPVLFAVGLIGLHARFRGGGGLPAAIGRTLAGASGGLAVLGLVYSPPNSTDESFSPAIFGAFLANIAALILLGIATRLTSAFPTRWSYLPLAMGVSTLPLMAVGGALESISERLLEIPLLVIAIAWIWAGYLIRASQISVPGVARGPTA